MFVAAFVGVQLALILSADQRPDRVFGFRMFNESSSLEFELFRLVRRRGRERLVSVHRGAWSAKDHTGRVHEFHWTDRVRYGALMRPSVFVHATYGLDAQLFRLQRALDDVAAHTAEDAETLALVAVADTVKNGREAGKVRLSSARRDLDRP